MQTPFKVILASKSPRRLRFFNELGLEVEIRTNAVKEDYPAHLKAREIPDYLAQLKANALKNTIKSGEILVTSDTVVWHKNHSLAKPKDRKEAYDMLRTLSNDWHEVITSVCFTTKRAQRTVGQTTRVKFRELQNREIEYYIDNYRPFDKAGGYGIQEWIGLIGIEEIQGSYSNVVGLPTHLVYTTLRELVGDSLMDNIEKNTAL
ncbi:Maf family nucleotide pyrophosphatase [Flavobacteriaceae bacterium F89]|uniref:dTTP/UTP pyrophosphatase n=1 Tax=Cerina litoralis TaxID=2874477 RepID=A0AAE3JRI3_9FLAO|nr:Maf family nucleotide pyrophosphatase [Cerina litoralis]MCG2461383.1 Maf family nucleotide pyrophosphatase [Cerina litoralis]